MLLLFTPGNYRFINKKNQIFFPESMKALKVCSKTIKKKFNKKQKPKYQPKIKNL